MQPVEADTFMLSALFFNLTTTHILHFSLSHLRIWQVVNIFRALINTGRPSPFCVFLFKNYWLLNTRPVSHKEVSLFARHNVQRQGLCAFLVFLGLSTSSAEPGPSGSGGICVSVVAPPQGGGGDALSGAPLVHAQQSLQQVVDVRL